MRFLDASIRILAQENEKKILCDRACLSVNSRGRAVPEDECNVRTCFQRDRDRIIHCQAFRRLKHKTQVFLAPSGDHYRTRLTHTLEVAQIARTIARALRLNEDLTEAVALGHDLGHTPFGHAGERALNQLCENGFRHYEQSVRVVEKIENFEGIKELNYSQYDFDLQLSGHAHGGQWIMPFIGPLFSPGQGVLPKYARGTFGERPKLIVSRGLGNSEFPLRLFNHPEIVVVNIEQNEG